MRNKVSSSCVLCIKICNFGDKDMNSNQIIDKGRYLPSHKNRNCPKLIETELLSLQYKQI